MIAAYFTVAFLGTVNESIVHCLPKATQKWIENGETDVNGMLDNILTMKSPADLVLPIFLVGALPAIGEELFFRGILQKFFIQIFKSAWPGIIFTGFLFSAIHMQFMGFLPRMALGIILGALYWYSGSLYSSPYWVISFLIQSTYCTYLFQSCRPGFQIAVPVHPFSFLGLDVLALVVIPAEFF